MILEKMVEEIERGVQDDSFTLDENILPLINEALGEAAFWFCHEELNQRAEITALADPSVSMPADFHHNLYRVVNLSFNRPVSIRTNIDVLEDLYEGITTRGVIEDVAVVGTELFFKPGLISATTPQDLKLFYYKKPDELIEGDMALAPGWLPEQFHRGMVVNYVLKELFALIEDGIEGQKVNTEYYQGEYAKAFTKLRYHTRHNSKERPKIRRTARFF